MRSVDPEDDRRIARHRQERMGWGFTTVEQSCDIKNIMQTCDPKGSFLLDSLTALLANEMFLPGNSVNEHAANKIIDELSFVLNSIENIVVVSDYIYSDAICYHPITENYRKSLAAIDKVTAEISEIVLEVSYTNVVVHKGREGFNAIHQKIM